MWCKIYNNYSQKVILIHNILRDHFIHLIKEYVQDYREKIIILKAWCLVYSKWLSRMVHVFIFHSNMIKFLMAIQNISFITRLMKWATHKQDNFKLCRVPSFILNNICRYIFFFLLIKHKGIMLNSFLNSYLLAKKTILVSK